jgi:hypothetical protein
VTLTATGSRLPFSKPVLVPNATTGCSVASVTGNVFYAGCLEEDQRQPSPGFLAFTVVSQLVEHLVGLDRSGNRVECRQFALLQLLRSCRALIQSGLNPSRFTVVTL